MAVFFGNPKRRREPNIKERADWPEPRVLAKLLGYERRARLLRRDIFEGNVINDSSWPLLQDLFAAHLQGEKMRTKELCATSGLPQTTVLRYLDHLEKFDVVRRENDPDDSRVTLVSVTQAGVFWMHEYYSQVIVAEQELAKSDEGVFSLHQESGRKIPGRS